MAEEKKADEGLHAVAQKDIDLIKASFDEDLLKIVRALFLGLEVTANEKALVKKAFANPDLRALMAKRFYPQLERDTPIGQASDIWLGAEQMVFGYTPDTIYQAVRYKQLAIDMIKLSLALLENPEGPRPSVAFEPPVGPTADRDVQLQTALLARNMYIRLVESQLLTFWLTTQQKAPENPKEAAKKKAKDGNK